ncbi:methylated-DNA--[protein]-cysteine S-methyltransferase [Wenyingzhuangia sp. 1_MG-2023]|nr:methylated-DNA--[protein]-cysteine S-methyltransferase [Wenyingzhuangia sp. 1_MG-2023]
MNKQAYINYGRVAEAIRYIQQGFKTQPTLEEIAAKVHMSPYHFQRLFTDWVGVSPKKFLQYISLQYAKKMLRNGEPTLFDTAEQTGLSGTGRLHNLFVKIEGMTPGEYKNQGENLIIHYSYFHSLFGQVLIASTSKGICYMGFVDDNNDVFSELFQRFPKANFIEKMDELQQNALKIYRQDWNDLRQIKLHLKGTDFQLKVWEALLKIPMGNRITYGAIAKEIEKPKASRAVGTAIGSNPIAFLIPCHRVIQTTGSLGGYRWGTIRKTAMLGWETAQNDILDL